MLPDDEVGQPDTDWKLYEANRTWWRITQRTNQLVLFVFVGYQVGQTYRCVRTEYEGGR